MKDVVEEAILDDGSEELGDLGQIDMRVLMEEAVFVEQAMQDASIDFLLLDNLRLLEGLEGDDQVLDTFIDLVWLCTEDMLEVFVGGFVNLLGALGWAHLSWEQNRVLGYEVFDLSLNVVSQLDKDALGLLREVRVRFERGWALHE